MGTRGPAPQSAELRVLKGNGKDRDPAHKRVRRQPKAIPAVPERPEGLGEHGERAWDQAAPELARMGILSRPDGILLEAWCRSYQLWKEHDGGRGYPSLTMTLANLGSKLGLDPTSRLRMTLPEAPDDEEADIFGAGTG